MNLVIESKKYPPVAFQHKFMTSYYGTYSWKKISTGYEPIPTHSSTSSQALRSGKTFMNSFGHLKRTTSLQKTRKFKHSLTLSHLKNGNPIQLHRNYCPGSLFHIRRCHRLHAQQVYRQTEANPITPVNGKNCEDTRNF